MTKRTEALLRLLKSGEYKHRRTHIPITLTEEEQRFPEMRQDAILLEKMLAAESPVFFPDDRLGFHRSNTEYCHTFNTKGKWVVRWRTGNMIPDYETALNSGMDAILERIEHRLSDCEDAQRLFLESARDCVQTALRYADREAAAARKQGMTELADCLSRVPHRKAETFADACVFLCFLHFTLRCNANTHIPLGRFDRYMRPFYEADLRRGKSEAELKETLSEFFLWMNFDTDLYHFVQTGDNGQSLVLGGEGSFDRFSQLCMEVSMELQLIDPKINLRVDKNTPDSLYELGTQMTKQGLGFPQYSNDDVVIPALIKMGYDPKDAADYAMAACWEFIIPGKGRDVPNLNTMSFPAAVEQAVKNRLSACGEFEELVQAVEENICRQCDELMARSFTRSEFSCSPYFSVFFDDCIGRGLDLCQGGAKYNNIGFFSPGLSTAADSLAAIREVVYETKEISKEELLEALEKDFEGFGALRNRLLACPKMGQADERADAIGRRLMQTYGDYLTGKPNSLGGIFRAGTGSAHQYILNAKKVGATADGRRAFAPFASSFSPSPEARCGGPLSVIRSFTGFQLENCMNGGPLTMELSSTVFRNEDGIKKVAQLAKAFIHLGGHQLQLNCLSRETLLEAEAHPEQHKDLIVRVWGWSGYYVELEEPYRKHILNRTAYTV